MNFIWNFIIRCGHTSAAQSIRSQASVSQDAVCTSALITGKGASVLSKGKLCAFHNKLSVLSQIEIRAFDLAIRAFVKQVERKGRVNECLFVISWLYHKNGRNSDILHTWTHYLKSLLLQTL